MSSFTNKEESCDIKTFPSRAKSYHRKPPSYIYMNRLFILLLTLVSLLPAFATDEELVNNEFCDPQCQRAHIRCPGGDGNKYFNTVCLYWLISWICSAASTDLDRN